MKNLKQQIVLITFIVVLALQISFANEPKYKISAENVKHTSSSSLEFDIYLQHTNPNESKFNYILGQYLFDFNEKIANSGTLTYSMVSSELPENLRPGNATVAGSILRLATNSIPSVEDHLFTISGKSPGTLIAKMNLQTSAKEFSDVPLELKCRVGPENPYTKICYFENNAIIEIKNSQEENPDIASKGSEVANNIPKEFSLSQNYPNPFNPTTMINYELPITNYVTLKIYDIVGKEVATLVSGNQTAGSYSVQFDGSNFASGIYFYKIKAGDFVQTRKMFLIK